MKITVQKKGNTFKPSNSIDSKLIELKPDGFYVCELKKARNIKHNSKYWLLCQALSFHFSENTAEKWHRYFKIAFLGYDQMKLPDGKVIKLEPSTAFEKMDQVQFDEYYSKIEEWLQMHKLSVDELINSI